MVRRQLLRKGLVGLCVVVLFLWVGLVVYLMTATPNEGQVYRGLERKRIIENGMEEQIHRRLGREIVDVEIEAKIAAIPSEELEAKIEKELVGKLRVKGSGYGARGRLGFCHTYWAAKKNVLIMDYGIDWKTPAELNPHIFYD